MERQLRDSSCSEKRKAKWFFCCWHELRKREIMYDNHNDNINKEVHCHAYTSSLFLQKIIFSIHHQQQYVIFSYILHHYSTQQSILAVLISSIVAQCAFWQILQTLYQPATSEYYTFYTVFLNTWKGTIYHYWYISKYKKIR